LFGEVGGFDSNPCSTKSQSDFGRGSKGDQLDILLISAS